jgi:hypothetical protein
LEDTQAKKRRFRPNLGGPYKIEMDKKYKPIFMIYFDLNFGITLTLMCIAYYWATLEDHSTFDFIPW